MRKEEIIEKNIVLTFDFLREVIKNPKIIDGISLASHGPFRDFLNSNIFI